MFKSNRALRVEPLEGRMMLSISVGIEDSTISVTSNAGADDMVEIEQTWSKHLLIKDHGMLVEKIDLTQFDDGWNLYVDLAGGDDRLYINKIWYGLNRLDVHTGGVLGFATTDSDNDMVELRRVKAHAIDIDTGATFGINGFFNAEEQPWNDTAPYQDNDVVKLYETVSYGGDLAIRTGAEMNVGFATPALSIVASISSDGNDAHQMVDNDRVHVVGSRVMYGNLDIQTGMQIHATVWHDHLCVETCDSLAGTTEYTGSEISVSVQDNDYVGVKKTDVVQGNVLISTGVEAHVRAAEDDMLDASVLEGNEVNSLRLEAHFDDQDIVNLAWVRVRQYDKSGNEQPDAFNSVETGNVEIHTGAKIVNDDPYLYLAAATNDNDDVSLNGVKIGHSLYISTGVGVNGMIGDLVNGDGSSDRDRVQLKYVRQMDPEGTTNVSLGDDDDHLRIYGSRFRGHAKFDGGDGTDTKKVIDTFFANAPEFSNFEPEHDSDKFWKWRSDFWA